MHPARMFLQGGGEGKRWVLDGDKVRKAERIKKRKEPESHLIFLKRIRYFSWITGTNHNFKLHNVWSEGKGFF